MSDEFVEFPCKNKTEYSDFDIHRHASIESQGQGRNQENVSIIG